MDLQTYILLVGECIRQQGYRIPGDLARIKEHLASGSTPEQCATDLIYN
jgi:hypothetical protein